MDIVRCVIAAVCVFLASALLALAVTHLTRFTP